MRRLVAACLLLAAARGAGAYEEPVSAFAASVGARDGASGSAPGVTVYVVPYERTFLLTDILVANHGQEVGQQPAGVQHPAERARGRGGTTRSATRRPAPRP